MINTKNLEILANFVNMYMEGHPLDDVIIMLHGSTNGIYKELLEKCSNDLYVALGVLYIQVVNSSEDATAVEFNKSLTKKVFSTDNIISIAKVIDR